MMDWDGAPLGDEAIIDSIEWPDAPATKPSVAPLEEAIRRASRADGGRRGVVIEGAPGSGKSVLSRVLEGGCGDRSVDTRRAWASRA
jgi:MoxR-like ATPase